jgi:prepilin-type N-terminal cleavage/methylation domain-containing protein
MRSGFTFVELVLVVGIVAILAGSGVIFYGRFVTQNQVDTTADLLVQNIRKAQMYAMESRKSETVGWGVRYAAGSPLTLYLGATYATKVATWDENSSKGGNVTVSAFEVNFTRLTGMPDGTESITISGMGTTKTVTVNARGTVTRT